MADNNKRTDREIIHDLAANIHELIEVEAPANELDDDNVQCLFDLAHDMKEILRCLGYYDYD